MKKAWSAWSLQFYLLRKHLAGLSLKSLSARMFLTTILLVAIPLAATNVYGYITYSEQTEQHISRSFLQVSQQIHDQIDNLIQQSYNTIVSLEVDEDLQYLLRIDSGDWRNNTEEYYGVSDRIQSLFSWQLGIRGLFVISADGGVMHEYVQGIVKRSYPFTGQEFFRLSQSANRFVVSGPHPQDYVEGKSVFSVDKPIYDAVTKRFLGMIRLDLDAEYLYRFFQNIEKGNMFMVLNETGEVIYRSRNADGSDKIGSGSADGGQASRALLDLVASGEGKGGGELMLDGVDSLVAFNTSELTGWKLVGIVPKEEVYLSVYNIRRTLLWLGIGAFLAILFCTAMLITSILKPLHLLNQGMIKIGEGVFTTRIATKVPTELKFIIEQYNSAVERLKHLTDELYVTRLRQQDAEIAAQQLKIDQQSAEMKRQEAVLRQRDAEMSQLQAQINPHFLYNTLSSIQSMAEMEETKGIEEAVKHLSKMLRYSIDSNSFFVPVSYELAHVNAFVRIQHLRHGSRIRFELEADENAMERNILRLTLQPLVENAYFHGLEPKLGGGTVRLRLVEEGARILIAVIDDGVGMPEEQLKKLRSWPLDGSFEERLSGLRNVIRRLQLAYGDRFEFDIRSGIDEGTQIRIAIPKS